MPAPALLVVLHARYHGRPLLKPDRESTVPTMLRKCFTQVRAKGAVGIQADADPSSIF